MKKLTIIIALLMCISLPMTAYAQSAQSEIDAANEQAAANAANGQTVMDIDDGVLAQQEAMDNANAVSSHTDGAVGRGTVENPCEYWEANGYPDNIAFAFDPSGEILLEDGTSVVYFEIGIVNADEASKQKIIDLLSPNCFITFTDCTWSYNQRQAIRNEILAMNDEKIIDVVLMTNRDGIFVIVLEDSVAHYTETLSAQFGDIISVGGSESTPVVAQVSQMPLYQNNWIFLAILTLLCGIAITLYFNRTRFIPAMQTNSGNIVTGNAPISRKQTIALIKDSALTPSDDVFKSIMEKIDTKKSNAEQD